MARARHQERTTCSMARARRTGHGTFGYIRTAQCADRTPLRTSRVGGRCELCDAARGTLPSYLDSLVAA
eukprot:8659972-Pyramimonas_sp.AAC.1